MDPLYKRAAVKRRLLEIAEQVFATPVDLGTTGRNAEVIGSSYDWAGDIEGDSALYFGEIIGSSEPMSVSGKTATDVFEIGFRITVWGFADPPAADEAAMRAFNAFTVPLRAMPHLVGDAAPTTAMDAVGGTSPFDCTAVLSAIEGPTHVFPQSDGDDYSGAINGSIRCTTDVK